MIHPSRHRAAHRVEQPAPATRPTRSARLALAALAGAAALAAAASPAAGTPGPTAPAGPLTLDLSLAMARQPATAPATTAPATTAPAAPGATAEAAAPLPYADRYGLGGTGQWYLSLTGGAATNFKSTVDAKFSAMFSTFLADGLEFGVDAAGWAISQPGRDTGAGSVGLTFRYHFWHAEDYDWSVFGQAGIGLLVAGRAVPQGGTNVNFLPSVGAGFTKRLTAEGLRLIVGAGWHHISNAQLRGDDRNPSRDGLMIYAGVVMPF